MTAPKVILLSASGEINEFLESSVKVKSTLLMITLGGNFERSKFSTFLNAIPVCKANLSAGTTDKGASVRETCSEILRVSVGAGEKTVETLQAKTGRKFESPVNQTVASLMDYDDIDYDENSELLYHLAEQAVDAIGKNIDKEEYLPNPITLYCFNTASSI